MEDICKLVVYKTKKRFRNIACGILILFSPVLAVPSVSQSSEVPGIIINHVKASDGKYIGSPGICVLKDGSYIASHDYFGPQSSEYSKATTLIFKSSDKGKTWKRISEINGQFWSNLFVHENQLYIAGTYKHHGNFIIRRSTDGGINWTDPADSTSGLILEGEYHTAPVPVSIHNGRVWRALENASSYTEKWGVRYSAMVISAPVESDLLNASSWKASNFLRHDSTYLNGNFGGWLEGNVVVTPEGKVVDFLRVATSEAGRDMAAIVNISDDGTTASFDPAKGFLDFAGGSRKFTIRFDVRTGLYWTITNLVTDEFKDLPAGSVRNTLVLKSSPDLIHWNVNSILLSHPDVKKHGFQYVDWQFEGKDIIYVCRTAFDDKFGGAHNYHDANYLTFHRIKNYKRYIKRDIDKNFFSGGIRQNSGRI
jgi:hypothetical protein